VLTESQRERNILHEVNRRKANWLGHISRRNCLLKYVMEGNIRAVNQEEDVSSYWMNVRKSEDVGS
jgi:hypothetical protein